MGALLVGRAHEEVTPVDARANADCRWLTELASLVARRGVLSPLVFALGASNTEPASHISEAVRTSRQPFVILCSAGELPEGAGLACRGRAVVVVDVTNEGTPAWIEESVRSIRAASPSFVLYVTRGTALLPQELRSSVDEVVV